MLFGSVTTPVLLDAGVVVDAALFEGSVDALDLLHPLLVSIGISRSRRASSPLDVMISAVPWMCARRGGSCLLFLRGRVFIAVPAAACAVPDGTKL